MKKQMIRLIALCMAAMLLLSGCGVTELLEQAYYMSSCLGAVSYSSMEYIRPDMQQLQDSLEECRRLLQEDDLDAAMNGIYAFYEHYDRFSTSFSLADIRYSGNLTDTYWEEEYNYCAENAAAVDAALDELYTTAAASPLREQLESDEYFGADFFLAYDEPSVWDDAFLALLEEEASLESRYYALAGEATETEYYSEDYFDQYTAPMAELFVELVALRQQIAQYAGYEDYPSFAYDFYHYRDYTPQEAEQYLQQVGQLLYEPYCAVNASDAWEASYDYCSEEETFQYVRDAAFAMGGTVGQAFSLLQYAGLYDISYGENKYDSSFEVFLWSYYEPFIFMCPYMDQTDKLTFAHEFGHFANDFVCGGSYVGIDVAEVHSQAFEYLSLCYSEDAEALTRYKLASSLCTYVEQAAYALFEHQVYQLPAEELTVENVLAMYADIGHRFGFDAWGWDSRDLITIPHFYTDPMYIVGYVVSNDLAMQIYSMEQQEAGAGLALYEQCLTSQDSYIIQFAETYGLESPFAPGRLEAVAAEFQEIFT